MVPPESMTVVLPPSVCSAAWALVRQAKKSAGVAKEL